MKSRNTARNHRVDSLNYQVLEHRAMLDAGFAAGTQLLLVNQSGALETVRYDSVSNAQLAFNAYRASGQFHSVEFDQQVGISLIPNDASFGSLWGLQNTGQSAGTIDADIDVDEGWDLATDSINIAVGVIDTGVDYRHPDLYKNIWINPEEIPTTVSAQLTDIDNDSFITFWDLNDPINIGPGKITDLNGTGYIDGGDLLFPLASGGWADGIDQDPYTVGSATYSLVDDLLGWNFVSNSNDPLDDHNHGTHVAGTIGAMANNAVGVAGVNWKTRMAALKFLAASGSGTISNATLALDYATANGIRLTNNSWGGGGISTAFSDALTRAQTAGALFVAAAGNSNVNTDVTPHYPSSYTHDNIISVASSTRTDARSSFSNYGVNSVDLAAPGSDILSTTRNNTYSIFSGTSMATPHVAGTIALMWGQEESLSFSDVRTRILSTVDPLANWSGFVATEGRLNAHRALINASPRPTVNLISLDNVATESTSGSDSGSFTVTRTGETTEPLTVVLSIGGSASNGVDYAAISTTVIIPAGETSANLIIEPLDDSLGEPSETVVLTLAAADTYIRGAAKTATVNILDNEPVVSIVATDASAAEREVGVDQGVFTVTRSGPTDKAMTVLFNVSGTATNGVDYSRAVGSVRIPIGRQSAVVRIRPIDDAVAEATETVVLTLASHSSYFVGSPNSAALTIVDNEPTVTIAATDATAEEEGGGTNPGLFTITRTGGSTTQPLTVNLTLGGTATNGVDFTAVAESVTIPAGQTSTVIAINPIDDLIAEANETVSITVSANSAYRVGSPSVAAVNILDNEPSVSIVATDNSAAESDTGSDPATFVISRTGATTLPITVHFSIGGSATNGMDYANLATTVLIPAGASSATITIDPIDDAIGENSETVVLTLAANSGYKIGGPSTATATVLDNEPVVTVDSIEDTAREDEDGTGENPGEFTLTRVGTIANDLTVNFVISGTATNGVDYTYIPGVAVIPAGQLSTKVTVAPIDDLLVEGTETVILTLTATGAYRLGATITSTVEIRDNDIPPNSLPGPAGDTSDSQTPWGFGASWLGWLSSPGSHHDINTRWRSSLFVDAIDFEPIDFGQAHHRLLGAVGLNSTNWNLLPNEQQPMPTDPFRRSAASPVVAEKWVSGKQTSVGHSSTLATWPMDEWVLDLDETFAWNEQG